MFTDIITPLQRRTIAQFRISNEKAFVEGEICLASSSTLLTLADLISQTWLGFGWGKHMGILGLLSSEKLNEE